MIAELEQNMFRSCFEGNEAWFVTKDVCLEGQEFPVIDQVVLRNYELTCRQINLLANLSYLRNLDVRQQPDNAWLEDIPHLRECAVAFVESSMESIVVNGGVSFSNIVEFVEGEGFDICCASEIRVDRYIPQESGRRNALEVAKRVCERNNWLLSIEPTGLRVALKKN